MLKVYITDLAAYNNGALVGEWVSLPMEEEELSLKIKSILKAGEAECGNYEEHEEYFITDYEFEDGHKFIDVDEYSSVYDLNEVSLNAIRLSQDEYKRIYFLTEELGFELDEAVERYEDVIIYANMRLIDVVEESIAETIDLESLPLIISQNIDYESIKIDFEISGEFMERDGDVFYFVN